MNKKNNCKCVVCNVEEALLDSFSTQKARTHFKALASNYPVLNHFSSPLDAVAKLHEQGKAAVNLKLLAILDSAYIHFLFPKLGQIYRFMAFMIGP